MSYYEVPEHCTECGIEIYMADEVSEAMCYVCRKERKAEYDAEQSERA